MLKLKQIIINLILIISFPVLVLLIVLPFFADVQFNTAQKLEKSYRWKKAVTKYELAIKLDIFNTKYLAGYADFCVNQSLYHKDKICWLTRAEKLYRRALQLNPRCAEYYLNWGHVQIIKSKKEEGRIYIREAIKNFRQAVINDPQGFYISSSAGKIAVSVWNFLNDDEKEWILDRLKYCLELLPWNSRDIFSQIWEETGSFELLQKITSDNLQANECLYIFIKENNLWPFRKEQVGIVNSLRQKQDLEEFKRERLAKANHIKNIKRTYKQEAACIISRGDWQGKASNGKSTYRDGNMYWHGTVNAVINVPDGKTVVTIQAKGSQAYNIWPYMVVELDGEEIGETFVNSSEWKEYSFNLNSDGGIKVLSVTFLNDGGDWKKGIDRNLYIGETLVVKDVR